MLGPGVRRSPTRVSMGTASLSISNLFVFSWVDKLESPVTLPPGRARLATKPAPTGSGTFVITIGMVVVVFLNKLDTEAVEFRYLAKHLSSFAHHLRADAISG